MSSDRTDVCCATLPLIVATDYQRQGTIKKTLNGLKYYECTIDVTDTNSAVVFMFDVRVLSASMVICTDSIHQIVGPNQSQNDQQVGTPIHNSLSLTTSLPHYLLYL